MSGRVARFGAGAVLALALVACGGGKREAFVPPNPFPTRDAVAKMGGAPAKPPTARKVAPSPGFTVDLAQRDEATPVEQDLAKVNLTAGRAGAKALRCYARNLARFVLKADAGPDERVDRVMRGACGVTAPAVERSVAWVDAPLATPDAEVSAALAKVRPPEWKGHEVAVGVERGSSRVVAAYVGYKPDGELAVAGPDASGKVTLTGRARATAAQVTAWINQGETSAVPCEPDLRAKLPSFSFTCQLAASDATAWVQVLARSDGRILSNVVGQALVRRDPARAIEVPSRPSAPAGPGSGDVAAALVAGINQARAAVKLKPLAVAPEQSATNGRLTPHYFSASDAGDEGRQDQLALGMLAGWDVAGTIRTGDLVSALVSGATSPSAWLDYALEMPLGRSSLYQPDLEQIAVGTAPVDAFGGVGAVVTTYGFFRGADHDREAQTVFDAVNRARAAQSLGPALRIAPLPILAREAKAVANEGRDPMAALEAALSGESERASRSVRGWVFATHSLDALALPPELTAVKTLHLGVAVTHFKGEGMAWGVYVVYLVAPADQLPPK
jgi:hypothetical protein